MNKQNTITNEQQKRREQLKVAQKKFYEANKDNVQRKRIIDKIEKGKRVRVESIHKYFKDDKRYDVYLNYAHIISYGTEYPEEDVQRVAEKILKDNKSKKPKTSVRTTRSSKKFTINEMYEALKVAKIGGLNSKQVASDTTIDGWINKMTRLLRYLNINPADKEFDIIPYIKDVNAVMNAILKICEDTKTTPEISPKSVHNNIQPLINLAYSSNDFYEAIGDATYKKYQAKFQEYKDKEILKNVKKTETGERFTQDWELARDALEKVRKEEPNSQNHLIIAFYNQYQLRDNIGNVKIIPPPSKPPTQDTNYYDYKRGIFYNYRFKTDKRDAGASKYNRELQMNAEVQKIVRSLLDADPNRKYFIQKADGTPFKNRYNNSNASSEIAKAFNKYGFYPSYHADDKENQGVIKELRRAFISSPYYGELSDEDKIQHARNIQHSVQTANKIYRQAVKRREKKNIA